MSEPTATLPAPPHEPSVDLGELKEQLDRIEQMLQRVSTRPEHVAGELIPAAVVMKRMGYTNTQSFMVAVRRAGIPFVRVNRRRIGFEPRAVDAWIESRSTGRRRAA